jgi:hypothetical protein
MAVISPLGQTDPSRALALPLTVMRRAATPAVRIQSMFRDFPRTERLCWRCQGRQYLKYLAKFNENRGKNDRFLTFYYD